MGERPERMDFHATRQGFRQLGQGQDTGGPGKQEAAGFPRLVDQFLDRQEDLGRPLDLVDGRAGRKLAQEGQRIVLGQAQQVQIV